MSDNLSCDIFCKVVDNFGDVGIAYRVAKCLRDQKKFARIRLWVDQLAPLDLIEPELNAELDSQIVQKIRVIKWRPDHEHLQEEEIGNVVIEIFGCGLSESFMERLEERALASEHVKKGGGDLTLVEDTRFPKWINLEYLSAENWIPNFHLQRSLHPRFKLVSTYFFPGFSHSTGGLIMEKDLIRKRNEYIESLSKEENYPIRATINRRPKQFRISYFSYEIENLKSWLAIWGEQESPIHLSVTPTYLESFTKALGASQLRIGDRFQRGALSGVIEGFCSQEEFDKRLWSCDLNFVRGEDSFVRALWSGNTFIWQPYPTKDRKHIQKLNAFLERYLVPFPDHEKTILREFFLLWNGEVRSSRALALLWKSFMRHKESIASTVHSQSDDFCTNHGNLIDKLIDAMNSRPIY